MKQVYVGLSCLCLLSSISIAIPGLAKASAFGIGASERNGVHQDWLERNRFLYTVAENSMPGDPYGGIRDPMPRYQRNQDQSSGNMETDDINLPDAGVNRSMTPSADVPDSVHGGGPNPLPTIPNARPGAAGDPAVRDLSGSGFPAPSAPPGSLGR